VTNKLDAGIAASMDNEANVFDDMGTKVFFLYFFHSFFLDDLYIGY